MKNIYTWAALLLLLFSSSGAFFGGYHLVSHPDGSSIKLPLELLKHTPFKSFFIPGIVLFITIGLWGLLTIIVTIFQIRYHAKFIMTAGLMLTIWMLVQMALSTTIYKIQYLVLFVGIAQILCGLALDRTNPDNESKPVED